MATSSATSPARPHSLRRPAKMVVSRTARDRALAQNLLRSVEGIVAITILFPAIFLSSARSQTVTALYNFGPQNGSAAPEDVALSQGRDGELYGTSEGNGTTSYGSIFKISTSRVFVELFDFNNSNFSVDVCCPGQGLTLASDGNFYGVADGAGTDQVGVFFNITPSGTFTAIHDFAGGSDGATPFARPTEASDGNLYGITEGDGTGSTVYKYTPSSGNLSTIYQFSNVSVVAPLIQASDGFLYGTTANGGWAHCGTIFKMSTAGVVLQSVPFLCNAAGSGPGGGPLLQASDGNFYGITEVGGLRNGGTVFKMSPDFKISTLYAFTGKSLATKDGFAPIAGLIQATDGNLYGATAGGGANGMGTLYRISTSGEYQSLYSFNGSAGKEPQGTLTQHTNGMLYGTASEGGTYKLGTVYQVNLGLAPFITFVQRTGSVGQTAQILGQQFTSATSVTFNGIPATSFTVSSPTFLLATVPDGATSGPVVVTVHGFLTDS
jgi:uncharacterized repeat protein (TIGR03803 family)